MAILNVKSINGGVSGALGNGVANDTAGIQAAINTAVSGDLVYFPKGIYPCAGLVGKANVGLIAESWNAILFRSGGGTIFSAQNKADVLISGLAMDLNAASDFTTAVDCRTSTRFRLEDCYIYNSGLNADPEDPQSWTLHAILGSAASELRVTHNKFNGCQVKAAGSGGGGPLTFIANNTFTHAQNLAISYVLSLSSDHLGSCIIQGNHIYDLDGQGGIYVGSDSLSSGTSDEIFILDNIIGGTWTDTQCVGIIARLCPITRPWNISRNYIRNYGPKKSGQYGIQVKAPAPGSIERLIIESNDVENVDQAGISVGGYVKSGLIRGNRVSNCRGYEFISRTGRMLLDVVNNHAVSCSTKGFLFQADENHIIALCQNNRSINASGTDYEHIQITASGSFSASIEVIGGNQLISGAVKKSITETNNGNGHFDGWYHHSDFRGATFPTPALAATGSTSLSENNRLS